MGVREALNKNGAAKVVIGALLVLGALWWLMSSTNVAGQGKPKAFYTTDDGATWFADDADKLPPFDHDGKKAVMCFVYKAGERGTPFVSHLQRFTPEGIKQIEDAKSSKEFNPVGFNSSQRATVEIKLPKTGDKGWLPVNDPRALAIQQVKLPAGASGELIAVDPNK